MIAESTYRIKGFVEMNGKTYVADCVGPIVEVRPFSGEPENPGTLTVLYGKGLSAAKSIESAAVWFPDCSISIDRT